MMVEEKQIEENRLLLRNPDNKLSGLSGEGLSGGDGWILFD
jgi:hypothetical protein